MSAPARSHDLRVGPVTRTQIVRFAGAGGDFNPMHHSEPFAQAAGQVSVFAMGQLPAALLARLCREWVGDARMRALSVRFRDKLWPDKQLDLHGEVVEELVGDDGERCWRCALTATTPDGDVVVQGELIAGAASVNVNVG